MKRIRFQFAISLAFLAIFPVSLWAASVSGTVYHSDGITRFTDNIIYIEVIPGTDPCGDWDTVGEAVTSAADGTYTVSDLPPGAYYLRTSISEINYVNEWWAEAASVSDCTKSELVTVAAGESLKNKNFQIDPGATVSGTLYQSNGTEPFKDYTIAVEVVSGESCSGKIAGWTYSDASDGTYTVMGLGTGTYSVRTAISELNYVNEWWAESASLRDCSLADTFTLEAGSSAEGKDFQLDPGASISGTVYNEDGVTPFSGISIYIDAVSDGPCDAVNTVRSAYSNASDGTYKIVGLPAGDYYLRTSVLGPGYIDEWWAGPESVFDCNQTQSVTLGEADDISSKDFQLASEASISGTVYQSDGITPVTENGISVQVISENPCGGWEVVQTASVSPSEGSYHIDELVPGKYYLRTQVSGTGYVPEWWADPASVFECRNAEIIPAGAGAALTGKNFQLAPEAKISGTVYHSDGTAPLAETGISIEIISGDPCSGDVVTSFSVNSSDGTYTVTGLPGGTYYLKAVSDSDYAAEWWASPGSVKGCAKSQSVTVADGGSLEDKDFQLSAPEGDINDDDRVNLSDAILGLQVLTGQNPEGIYSGADANGDRKIGMAEVLYILASIGR